MLWNKSTSIREFCSLMNVCTNYYDINPDESWTFVADGEIVKDYNQFKGQLGEDFYYYDGLPNMKFKRKKKGERAKNGKNKPSQ